MGVIHLCVYQKCFLKITSKGKTTKPSENRVSAARSQNMKRKISAYAPGHFIIQLFLSASQNSAFCNVSLSLSADFELTQLQDRLNETKDVIESIISAASVCSHRSGYLCFSWVYTVDLSFVSGSKP